MTPPDSPSYADRAGGPPTPTQRAELGRAARRRSPRSRHGSVPRPPGFDPLALLQSQETTRVADLVPIRRERMAVSPFTFFRGGALLMAHDLAGTAVSGLDVQLCGDAHLSNFGLFGSPERQLLFDLNDFDETLPGPWEWDLKRLVASLEVAGRDNGFDAPDRERVVFAAGRRYQAAMRRFAGQSNLRVWYATVRADRALAHNRAALDPRFARSTTKTVDKARTRDHLQAFRKLIVSDGGELRFRSDPPLVLPVEGVFAGADADLVQQRIAAALADYRRSLSADRRALLDQYRLVHLARKVVGVGSVGTRAWVLLLTGRDERDPLVLQVKEAQRSVLEVAAPPSRYANQGQRVVVGQRLMQASSDILLGWHHFTGLEDDSDRDFYVRQLRDWKGSAEIEELTPAGLTSYGELCGWTLARAHARSGDRIAVASYLGRSPVFARALVEFASVYADLNEADHAAFRRAAPAAKIT